ncbi:MAG: metallophosphoesterase, partial [Clostridia bacterium]|nr:metallophosphoesterase [Clostridia bacterium]
MSKFGKLAWVLVLGLLIAALLLASILANALARAQAVVYTVSSRKLGAGMRLALISDLHSARYGPRQDTLIDMLRDYAPDAVLLAGDIFDYDASFQNAVTLIERVGAEWPCYFVFGNHEHGTKELEKIRSLLEEAGITILEGDCLSFSKDGGSIVLAGVDDVRNSRRAYEAQLEAVGERLKDEESFSILLSHEPQFIDGLLASGADLIVSGHTHGGQWSLPGIFNGLYAPGQGFFPKYAGGLYRFGDQSLIVSRGLAREPLCVP